jgi:hypothetical protein
LAKTLASATGSPAVNATEFTPFRPFSAASTCVPGAGDRGQLVLDHAVLAARLANHLAQLKILGHGQLAKVPIIAVVEVSSSLASNLTFSVFFALKSPCLRSDSDQGSVIRDQHLARRPELLVP